jgi:hypothetical protein
MSFCEPNEGTFWQEQLTFIASIERAARELLSRSYADERERRAAQQSQPGIADLEKALEYIAANTVEVFSTHLYRIERLGSCGRLVFVTEHADGR